MKRHNKILLLLAIFFLIQVSIAHQRAEFSRISKGSNLSTTVYRESDSLDVKIGQMLLVGFRGMSITARSPIVRDLRKNRIGGVILFDYDVENAEAKRNIASSSQVAGLTVSLQSFTEIPLFVAVDQEGGRVARLKTKYGFPASVSQRYLGALDIADSTRLYASRTAKLLLGMGINLNFAPVLDVNANPANPVIGKLERSFSSDSATVARNGLIMMDEFRKQGLFSSVKHFPGHGSSAADSHEGFVDVTQSWSHKELFPFAAAVRESACDMVMTAHIFNSRLDPVWPATLSHAIITHLLRDSLGYDGVVVSDDLQMKAISSHFGLETAIQQTILAGVDILLFGNNTTSFDEHIASRAVSTIKKLVRSGVITEARIDASFQRIMKLKRKLTIHRGVR